MRSLHGKKALITGAASGIGRAIALRLAEEGADLFVVDIDEPGLANVVAEARQHGVQAIGRRCDVSQPNQVSESVAAVCQLWSGVDVLVNNAGITYYGRTEQMSADHWDRVLRVNLLSHIQFTRELLPALLARRESHILNVCSIFGLAAMPKLAAYCTTKYAMVGFTESLRAEFGREGLGITALCPGFVTTNLFTSAPLPESMEQPKVPPSWACTTPERVADAAVRAIYRDRRMVVVEPFARLLYFLKRFVPGLMDTVQRFGRQRRLERRLARVDVPDTLGARAVSSSTPALSGVTAGLPSSAISGATGYASANSALEQPARRAA